MTKNGCVWGNSQFTAEIWKRKLGVLAQPPQWWWKDKSFTANAIDPADLGAARDIMPLWNPFHLVRQYTKSSKASGELSASEWTRTSHQRQRSLRLQWYYQVRSTHLLTSKCWLVFTRVALRRANRNTSLCLGSQESDAYIFRTIRDATIMVKYCWGFGRKQRECGDGNGQSFDCRWRGQQKVDWRLKQAQIKSML